MNNDWEWEMDARLGGGRWPFRAMQAGFFFPPYMYYIPRCTGGVEH